MLLLQHLDEQLEALLWASREGCLEDVVFFLSTGVELNSRGQVRLELPLLNPLIFRVDYLSSGSDHVTTVNTTVVCSLSIDMECMWTCTIFAGTFNLHHIY